MKILYCIPSLSNPGGMERVITEKVNYLAALSGFEIFIVTTDQMGKDIRFNLHDSVTLIHLDLDFDGHFNVSLIKKFLLHRQKLIDYKQKLLNIMSLHNIEICISLCGKEIEFFQSLPVPSKKIAELHFAMNFRKQFITARKSGFIWSMFGNIRTYQFKRAVKHLDKLVVLTKNDMHQWKATHSNIIQIPNPSPFRNVEVSDLDSKNVITVGKLDPQKGYDMLIDAWALINKKCPDWMLNIYGQGEWKEMLVEKIAALNLQEVVVLHGVSMKIADEYKRSSFYVMSSRFEGLPMVLIEAMSFGLPVISFDCEFGPSEIVTDGVDGYLVEPNNIEELANRICFLIENEDKRKLMGQQAIINVRRFDKETVMQQWLDLFDSLMKS